MGAHVEWTHGVLRAGIELNEYGDPYEFVCTVLRRGEEVELIGAAGHFSKQTYEQIRTMLAECGITKVRWDRVKPEAKVSIQVPIGDKSAEEEKVVTLIARTA